MWFLCKVIVILTLAGISVSARRPENNRHVGGPIVRRRSTVEDVDLLQSPTFSILSHMAQPLAMRPRRRTKPEALPIKREEPQLDHDERIRSMNLPFRSNKKPDERRKSKPSFNIALDTAETQNTRSLPPVYVPHNQNRPSEGTPAYVNDPEFILADEDSQYKPTNFPRYVQNDAPRLEFTTSALLTPDPESESEKLFSGGNQYNEESQLTDQYGKDPPNSYPQREFTNQPEVLREPLSYMSRPQQRDRYVRPDVQLQSNQKFLVQPNKFRKDMDQALPPQPKRVVIPQTVETNEFFESNLNSYNRPQPEININQQPKRVKVAEHRTPSKYSPQNVPKKILKKQPSKSYENFVSKPIEQHLKKRQSYDQDGSPSIRSHLDQNGVEFISDAAKTLKKPGGRITFQIHGQEGPHSYRFGYDTGNGPNRQFRYEEKDGYGEVKGRYGFYDGSGKLQMVNYSAHPEHGYQAESVPAPTY